MLTPGDVRNKGFEKVRNGYRPEDVQAFLGDAASGLEYLLAENADLQKKLEILAEKVEQYREDEDSLRSALIGAQKLGDSIVRDSKRKAESIIAQATRKSEELVADAQASINREAIALSKMQVEVAKFKSQVLTLYKKHIELIQEIPYDEGDIQRLESGDIEYIAGMAKPEPAALSGGQAEGTEPGNNAIDLNFEPDPQPEDSMLSYSEEEAQMEFEGGEDDGDDAFPQKRPSRFGTLRFGDEYNLTRRGD
ncbi:MAG: DivIVA domain-containing protein [Oscillospiraceae bacterium]|nr:DivIVA domain-containing protein [Oscillospiraceae bacterium]